MADIEVTGSVEYGCRTLPETVDSIRDVLMVGRRFSSESKMDDIGSDDGIGRVIVGGNARPSKVLTSMFVVLTIVNMCMDDKMIDRVLLLLLLM